jgi:hypothetical protein
MPHLTDRLIRDLPVPEKGNKITYDDTIVGLGARITANGHRAFVLTYSVRGTGRQRRYTIGSFPDPWKTADAREEARRLRRLVDAGGDPLADLEDKQTAPTISDLVERFREEHFRRLRESSAGDYERVLRCHVVPHFGANAKVQDITFADCDALHRKISRRGHSHRANRTLAVLSKAFALAIRWGWCTDNPCRGIERNTEHNRQRYMTGDELARLTKALAEFPDRQVANAVRLLLLTGARRGGHGQNRRPAPSRIVTIPCRYLRRRVRCLPRSKSKRAPASLCFRATAARGTSSISAARGGACSSAPASPG